MPARDRPAIFLLSVRSASSPTISRRTDGAPREDRKQGPEFARGTRLDWHFGQGPVYPQGRGPAITPVV
ncbi:hypothetical protein GCM10012275_00800 [Longimycelium tulufanense]|uniref:Uncharacterized protein n=1 Tax=Longimycelium tulufanense TaxID=907463 RepID=A0A8J3C5I6_9PSEU|nr:hypothetical protein GCM10012275_00800 [Longimycelium tulufanense]